MLLAHLSAARAAYGLQQMADVQIEEAGNEVRAWLEHVNEFLKDEHWKDAVETLRRVMENRGDRLIEVATDQQWQSLGFAAFIPVSEYCQMQLAAWLSQAPQALVEYRQQVDALATRLYDEAINEGSEAKLQRVVDELMLSSVGDQALLRLGEQALERGNYTLARRSWESIHPQLRVNAAAARLLSCTAGSSWWSALRRHDVDAVWSDLEKTFVQPPGPANWLAYPDSDIPIASVRARLVLASLLEGSLRRAELEADLLRRLHPEASGSIGGKSGLLAELMAELIRNAETWPGPPRPLGWSTFAGSPARNGVAAQGVDVALRPIWRTPLPRRTDEQDRMSRGQVRVAESADGVLAYHVAVEKGVVYICEPDRIRALRLRDGEPAWPLQDAKGSASGTLFENAAATRDVLPGQSVRAGVSRWYVTLDRGRLFARLGAAWTGGGNEFPLREDQRSCLVGLDLDTQKLLFDRILPEQQGWEFESTPVTNGPQVIASLRRRDPASAQVKVVSYALATGRPVWERTIARGDTVGSALFEMANSPLSCSDDTLFYNTNLGAVVALRASDGRVRWLCRYRRSGLSEDQSHEDDRHFLRDLTPCLVDRGTVYVAATDSDRLFALDAGFGQVLWNTSAGLAADAVHLLGVAEDALLASGDYLYWLDAASGAVRGQFPAPRGQLSGHAMPAPRGFGRGVLAGREVYWPTRERIYVFDQASGRQMRQPIDLAAIGCQGGNLVVQQGVLLVASADELVAFNATGRVEASLEVAAEH
ncbi:MAG: outer membrane protein assembly factor BamB family protein [Pirellulaceae bacterium]